MGWSPPTSAKGGRVLFLAPSRQAAKGGLRRAAAPHLQGSGEGAGSCILPQPDYPEGMTVTLSIKIPVELRRQLDQVARERRTTASQLVRQALQVVIESRSRKGSCYDFAGDLFGDLGVGPRDLSTNASHLDDFGRGWRRFSPIPGH